MPTIKYMQCTDHLRNAYGPTETTIWSALHQLQSSQIPVSIGGPIAGEERSAESRESMENLRKSQNPMDS